MTIGRDEEIKAGLMAAGIPVRVLSTTLPREGHGGLRDSLTQGVFTGEQKLCAYVYPSSPRAMTKARTVFYLLAKEMFLSGTSVYALSLSRLVDALTNPVPDAQTVYMLENVSAVFVLNFYEQGAPFPFSPGQAVVVRDWVRERIDKGGSVHFLADAPVERCAGWWSDALIGHIRDHSLGYTVS